MSKKVGSDKLKAGVVKVDKIDFPYTIRKDRKTKPLYARFGREVKNYKDDGTPVNCPKLCRQYKKTLLDVAE